MLSRCTRVRHSSSSSSSSSPSPLTASSLHQWFQQCRLFSHSSQIPRLSTQTSTVSRSSLALTTSTCTSTSTSQSTSPSSLSHSSPRRHYAHYHRSYTSLNYIFASQIAEYARRPQRGVTLQEMIKVGQEPSQEDILKNAVFLYKELPIRLAKKVKELESLPYGLSLTKPVQKVKGWYEQSFRDILALPVPQTVADDQQFTATLERILDRHANVVPTMALGVLQMKKDMGADGDDIINTCPFLHDFLNRFYTSRIGIRMLISQHVSLHHPRADYIGNIATNLSPVACARAAVQDAAHICDKTYGAAPEVTITGNENQTIHYVPSHLNYILFELLKNSMRAVIEFHGVQNPPAIDIVIIEDDQDFAIKISDAGGGMTRKDMGRIWSYMHTTANKNVADLLDQLDSSSPPPMAGFGYGLPISRLYARYFGGDLQLISMHGYGTDAYVYLHKLGGTNLFLD